MEFAHIKSANYKNFVKNPQIHVKFNRSPPSLILPYTVQCRGTELLISD